MEHEFYCGACGKLKPLSEKVERGNKRPKCRSCEHKARANSNAASQSAGQLKRRAPAMNAAFMRWVSHV